MLLGLRVVGSAFRQVLTHVTASVLSNLLAVLLSVPIILVVGAAAFATRSYSLIPLGIALLGGVLPNPCAAGVHTVAQEFSTAGYATFEDHWLGLRRHFFAALKVWLVSVAVTVLIVGNIVFYISRLGTATGFMRSVAPGLLIAWAIVLLTWLAIHLYVYPLLLTQEVTSVRLTYRNAFMMAVARPAFTAFVVPVWLLLLLLFSATGIITFVGLSLCCAIQHTATRRLLPTFRLSPSP